MSAACLLGTGVGREEHEGLDTLAGRELLDSHSSFGKHHKRV